VNCVKGVSRLVLDDRTAGHNRSTAKAGALLAVLIIVGVLQGSCFGPSTTTTPPPSATLTSIAVAPANPTIANGSGQQFSATGHYSDGSAATITTSVTWSSSAQNVATISNAAGSNGLSTSVGSGSTTIQASLNGVNGSTMLTVSLTLVSIGVTPSNPTITMGSTEQFVATGHYSDGSTATITTSVTWSSSAQNVATISNAAGSNGLATSVGSGSTTIQASLDGVNGSTKLTVSPTLVSIGVTPANPTIVMGSTEQFTATGTYSDQSAQDLTNSVTWGSTSQGIATISNSAGSYGLATSVGVGSTTISATMGATNGATKLTVAPTGVAAVTTYHYDNGRTGQNTSETILTPANVNMGQFGKLFALPVDGQVYAQPLYVTGLAIPGKGTHNVVFAATENDSVYAFDADSNMGADATYLWKASLVDAAHGAPAGATAITASGQCPAAVSPTMGITSTPVIDTSTNTMYVVAFSQEGSQLVNRLHAIDITTGNEKSLGPVVIDATVSGTGDGSSNGQLTFSKLSQFIRPALLLSSGTIYVGSAALCESINPFHGWILAYNASTFAQKAAIVTTPNGGDGGFWMSGAGLAADATGNVYGVTGNGTFDTNNVPATELGDTIVKYSGSNLGLLDYFTPYDQLNLDLSDDDLGSGGVLLLPDQPGSYPHLLVQAGKEGTIYLINRDQMASPANQHYCSGCTVDTEIVQELQKVIGGMWSMPAYWNGNIYVWGQYDSPKAFKLTNGVLGTAPSSTGSAPGTFFGQTPSVSSNGTTNGIVWAISFTKEAILYAYDATNLGNELYSSEQAAGNRDIPGNWAKFSVPVIVNGKVYIGTATEVDVYGLLP
jgi:hypothetical protein